MARSLYRCMQSKHRTCEVCGETKKLEDFATAGITNGVKYYRYKCKACYSVVKYARKSANREWFNEYRKTLSCKACGLHDHRVLEFHHRDPSAKEKAVTTMMYNSREKIEAEIAKCDVLCANCHRILHYEERLEKKRGLAQSD